MWYIRGPERACFHTLSRSSAGKRGKIGNSLSDDMVLLLLLGVVDCVAMGTDDLLGLTTVESTMNICLIAKSSRTIIVGSSMTWHCGVNGTL